MQNTNRLGILIAGISLVAIVLLAILFAQIEGDRQNACALSCGGDGGDQCTVDSCPYHQGRSANYVIWGAAILVAGLGGIGVFLALGKEQILQQRVFDLSGLSDEEKRAFHLVRESSGGMYQSELVKRLGVSKVQMTRLLDKLEQQGLVERKRRGMTNVVLVKRN